eukprot:jgi/Botrbrau1/19275/Bobra.0073s0022.1
MGTLIRYLSFLPSARVVVRCRPTSLNTIHRPHPRFLRLTAASGIQDSGETTETMAAGKTNKPKIDLSKGVPLFPLNPPEVKVTTAAPLNFTSDLLALGIFEDALDTSGETPVIKSEELKKLDTDLQGKISNLLASVGDFSGKKGQSQFFRFDRIVGIIGLGPKDKAVPTGTWGPSVFEVLGSVTAANAKTFKAKTAAVAVVDAPQSNDTLVAAVGKIAAGLRLGGYEATRFKNKPTVSPLQSVEIVVPGAVDEALFTTAVQQSIALASGTLLARYLTETPPNICTPAYLATVAKEIADIAPDVLSLKVLEKEDCEALGMGCYLAVTACSALPPKFIHLTYKPPGEVKKVIGLVGKGLTFDSGGYNLKVGGMIEYMKFDMGGCAAVLGAAYALSQIKPPGVEVHIISAACENMIDGHGMRPGDILQAANGKTVEVGNTDAEGRLTLADALWYAQEKCGVTKVLDIATLTGAQIIALGDQIAAFFTPSEDLDVALVSASKITGERFWRLPLEDTYWDFMKSPIADMKNVGGRVGGCITAALFIREFIDVDKVEWAHIDIAGPCWVDKQGGATGFGASTLAEWTISQGL